MQVIFYEISLCKDSTHTHFSTPSLLLPSSTFPGSGTESLALLLYKYIDNIISVVVEMYLNVSEKRI